MAVCYKCGATLHAVVGMRGKCQTCFQIEVTENLNKIQEKNLRQQEEQFRRQRELQADQEKAFQKQLQQQDYYNSEPYYAPKVIPKAKVSPTILSSLSEIDKQIFYSGGGLPPASTPTQHPYLSSTESKNVTDYTNLLHGLLGLFVILVLAPWCLYLLACLGLWLLRLVVWWAFFQEQYLHTPSWIWIGF
jgi:hypothetical protein